jgi:hypothetical protein
MTELNPSSDAGPDSADSADSADARIDWPAPADGGAARATDHGHAQDPAVDALLVRLGTLPDLPVSAHGEVYAGLHDALAEALNEDVAGMAAGDPRP